MSGLVYFFLGETRDATMLMIFVIVVISITFYQERKTERAVEALRNLSSPRALVIRDGENRRIAGREVVVDDLIILREGDRIPADAVILSASNLLVDESLLTGESIAVRKSVWDYKIKLTHPGGEDLPFVFFRNNGHPRPGNCQGSVDRIKNGNGQDRQVIIDNRRKKTRY